MARVFANVADDELASGISAGATSSTLVDASEFPATGDFSIRFEDVSDPTVFEIVTATARAGNVLTHAATASAWVAGDKVYQVLAKADLDEFLQETAAAATYQALSGKGANNGYASLDAGGDVPASQLGNVPAATIGDLLDYQFVRKTADESVTSSATLQNDDHLVLAIGANQEWSGRIVLRVVTADATPDFKANITVPTGATGIITIVGDLIPGGGGFSADGIPPAVGSLNMQLSGSEQFVYFDFHVRNSSTAGNIQFQWSQNTSNGTTVTVKMNSFLQAWRHA